jgi:WD40 repeat protein
MARSWHHIFLLFAIPVATLEALPAAETPAGVDVHGDPLPSGALARLGTVRFRNGSTIYAVAYSPDGRLLANGGELPNIFLWDASSGRPKGVLKGHTDHVLTVAFSPNGQLLASGSRDATIRLWDVATGQELCRLQGHRGRVASVAFAPAGTWLAPRSGWRNSASLPRAAFGEPGPSLPKPGVVWKHYCINSSPRAVLSCCGGSAPFRSWNKSARRRRGRF